MQRKGEYSNMEGTMNYWINSTAKEVKLTVSTEGAGSFSVIIVDLEEYDT